MFSKDIQTRFKAKQTNLINTKEKGNYKAIANNSAILKYVALIHQ